ncbi:hypothetical protein HYW73_03700 [Candidatus Nomurabacteria bacterium]|nr:hypothetical protein [Candidatus Nomurabacteria bacterium]
MNDTFENLYSEFLGYAERNDEAGARKFLIDNLQKFPEDIQDKITFAFFEEALQGETAGVKEIALMQKEGLEAMNQIDKAKKILEDKIKERDLRSKLNNQ